MTDDQFQSTYDLFARALECEPEDRERLLATESPDDVVLAMVQSLLETDERLGHSLLNPLLDSMMERNHADVVDQAAGQYVGRVLKGHYLLEEELASGMSSVYLASDLGLPEKR